MLAHLPLLLRPFRLAGAVDWRALWETASDEDLEPAVQTALALPEFRSRFAERLQGFEGFAEAKPVEVRSGVQTIRVEFNPEAAERFKPGVILAFNVKMVQGVQGGVQVGDRTTFGNVSGSNIIIKSKLEHVQQTIGAAPGVGDSAKEELTALVGQLSAALEAVPAEMAEVKEAVAEYAKQIVEAAAQPKPNKTIVQISGDNLKKAAENLKAVMPTILVIATQIVEAVKRLASPGGAP